MQSKQLHLIVMADCAECSEANEGKCNSDSELTATITLQVQKDAISVYKVELRWDKAKFSRSHYLWGSGGDGSLIFNSSVEDTCQLP